MMLKVSGNQRRKERVVMYAVVRTGGKQYRVSQGDRFRIEKIPGEIGQEVTFNDVLMIGGAGDVRIGRPQVEGASVSARILEQDRAKKVIVFQYKKRQDYAKKQGHRQAFTRVEVTGIQAPGA
jgi:large subunit ribosomal protein L21